MAVLCVLFLDPPSPAAVRGALAEARLEVQGGPSTVVGAGDTWAELEVIARPMDGAGLAEAALHSAWTDAAAAVARHQAHAVLTAPDEAPPSLLRLEGLTRVAAALLELPGAIALYDPAGGALCDGPEARRRITGRGGAPPLDLWIGVRTFELADASGWFLDTLGMGQLGLPDLEAYAGEGPATALVAAWLRNLGLYQAQEDARARLRHGDTLDGPDEQPWVTVEDVATVEPSRPVLRFVPVQRPR